MISAADPTHSSNVYWRISDVDQGYRLTQETLGNGVTTDRHYETLSGHTIPAEPTERLTRAEVLARPHGPVAPAVLYRDEHAATKSRSMLLHAGFVLAGAGWPPRSHPHSRLSTPVWARRNEGTKGLDINEIEAAPPPLPSPMRMRSDNLLPAWPKSRVLDLAPAHSEQTLQQEEAKRRLANNPIRRALLAFAR